MYEQKVQCSNTVKCDVIIKGLKCPHADPHIRNEWCKSGLCYFTNKVVSCEKILNKHSM